MIALRLLLVNRLTWPIEDQSLETLEAASSCQPFQSH